MASSNITRSVGALHVVMAWHLDVTKYWEAAAGMHRHYTVDAYTSCLQQFAPLSVK